MFEDKRLEKKLLHLKREYNNIDTTSDSEKILYHILNERDHPKKKPAKKYPFTYIASLAAVLLIGVFVGLSSLLGQGGSKSNEVNESLALDASPESAGEESYDGHSSGGTNDEQEESDGADQGKGMSKEEFIKKQEEEQAKYELENKPFYAIFEDQFNALYDKASEMLGISDRNKLSQLYSVEQLKQIIIQNYRNSTAENKYEITVAKLESFIANTNYLYGNELFEKMEPVTLDIYEEYKASGYDDEVLRGLEPFQVMALYLYASAFGDDELSWHLLIKSGNSFYPTKEEYDWGKEMTEEEKESRRQFMESIYMMEQIVYTVESGIIEHKETDDGLILIHLSEDFVDPESYRGFGLQKNDKGIWKVNFMPMQ